jgi:hypothetical protein
MKFYSLLIIGLVLGLAGCAEKEQASAPQGADAATAAKSATAESTVAETTVAETAMVERDEMGTASFISHMHHHASQLERLNAALEAGSLAAAQRPAYWLSGHDETIGVPDDWQVYVDGMRSAASSVSEASDLAAARAAAKRIENSCRGCHTAAGIEVVNLQPE